VEEHINLQEFINYPLDKFSLLISMLNPIDLSRILILLKLDISALLGYTGALFSKFFGTNLGMIISFFVLTCWIVVPAWMIVYKSKRKDF